MNDRISTHVRTTDSYDFSVDADVPDALLSVTRAKAFDQLRLETLGVKFDAPADPFEQLARSAPALEAVATLSAIGVPIPAIAAGARTHGFTEHLVARMLARHLVQALVQPLTILRG